MNPTARQLLVLAFIAHHADAIGYPPTIREICKAFGWTSTNAAMCHIRALEARGLTRRGPFLSARDLVVTPAGRAALVGVIDTRLVAAAFRIDGAAYRAVDAQLSMEAA